MEHIGEILKQTRTATSKANTGTWSGAEPEPAHPACPVCKDVGFVHPRLRSGKPDFTRAVPCQCTREKAERKLAGRVQELSGLARLQREMTFKSFDWRRVNLPAEVRANLKKAYEEAQSFAREPEGWLVFMGQTGCGKTHLAAAIANYCIQTGKRVLFVVVPDFLDHLRSTFSPDSTVTYDQVFEHVKSALVLILDDLGQQSATPWAREKLYQMINYRYNEKLPTVITMRCTLDDIDRHVDESVSSRLVDPKISLPFEIRAPDYRGDSSHRRK